MLPETVQYHPLAEPQWPFLSISQTANAPLSFCLNRLNCRTPTPAGPTRKNYRNCTAPEQMGDSTCDTHEI